jgi:endonuclease/exonuclease/phosphatase family metal-dependent hydrolase
VLLGDFNAWPDTPEIASVKTALTHTWRAASGGGPLATYPAEAPAECIDYIFTSQGLRAVWTSLGTGDRAASDHVPVVSRLALPRAAAARPGDPLG